MLAVAALCASCADPAGPAASANPVGVWWLEWPAAVTPAQPGSLLATIAGDFCEDLSIGVTASYPTVTLTSTSTPRDIVCPLTPSPVLPHDTAIALPALNTSFGLPISWVLRATFLNTRGDIDERLAGTFILASAPDTTRFFAGRAFLEVDSAGCPLLRGGVGFAAAHVYAVTNMPQLNGIIRTAFVGGHVVAAAAPSGCSGQRSVMLDFAEVDLVP